MATKKRKIYFSSSIDQREEHTITQDQKDILKSLLAHGTVTNGDHYLPDTIVDTSDEVFSESEEYLDQAQIFVADVNTQDLAIGRQIAYAQFVRKIPVLCLYRRWKKPAAILEGNEDIQVFPYETVSDIKGIIDNYFTHWIE